ncbi:GNAT family N-acetyltransferase [Phenylobacterium sp. J367]|uniref:GNAT family N-acetyltransferase n=1 Tax=Phenylobacterium sp. J367 TaxID=2898435 RepID=UPI002151CD46|nr:GNAT family N-acetyltransferase [Phenylobacterium sp. J367]MCR5880377.1 GNAT family N-acetyltransferase [Phenylobacterium sp. J367]
MELSAAGSFHGRDVPERIFSEFTPPEAWSGRQEAGTLWVAVAGGHVQAFLGATAHGERLHIDEFAVAQGHQGKGLGRRMLAEVIAFARGAGFRRLSLTTFRDVPFNGPFYASAGFRFWDDAPPEFDAILAGEAARGLRTAAPWCWSSEPRWPLTL